MYLTASGPVRKKEIQTRDQMGKFSEKQYIEEKWQTKSII